MLARPPLTKPAQEDVSKPKTQARPTEERFLCVPKTLSALMG
jgi:hypothetical protein